MGFGLDLGIQLGYNGMQQRFAATVSVRLKMG